LRTLFININSGVFAL